MRNPKVSRSVIALILVCLIAPLKFTLFGAPFILQSLALFTAAAVLGIIPGTMVAIAYLLLGLLGVPVFAGYESGLDKLVGPTAGFLLSFPLIAAYLAWQCRKGEQTYFHSITYFFRAHILWLIPGFTVLYLSYDGLNFLATLVKLLPDVLLKSVFGGLISFYLTKKIPLD